MSLTLEKHGEKEDAGKRRSIGSRELRRG